MNIAKDKMYFMHKVKTDSIISAINIALEDSVSQWEDNESTSTPTIFKFIYKDDSELNIDIRGHVTSPKTDCEYWIY